MQKTLLTLLALIVSFSAVAQKRAMTTDDYINMVNLRSSYLSPDGEFVIFGKSKVDWDENEYNTKYYYIPADSGDSYQYLGEEGGSDIKFSPDGKYISLKRRADKKSQIFLLPTQGGEAVQLTEHKSSVGSYEWGADSKTIYFESDVPKSSEEKKKYEAGYDHFFMDEPPHGQSEGEWNHLWKFDIDSKEETKLTHGELIIGSFTVSPDQKRLLYTAKFQNRRNLGNKSEIYLLQIGDSTVTQLTDNDAPEGSLTWLPDNKHFVYSAPDDEEWELRQDKLWKMNVDSKEYEMISGNYNGDMRGYYVSPNGKKIYFQGTEKTNTNLYSLNVDNGRVQRLSDVTGTFNVMDFDKKRETVLFSKEDIVTPADLYVADLGDLENPTRLTDLNPFVRDSLQLADYEVVSWESYDGLEIEGIKYTPAEVENDGSAPFLLHIHGGPAGVFTNSFSARYHVWAGLGYVQLAPNVRGSTAYGDEFLQGNMEDIGDGDYNDLMSGVDMMIENEEVDSDKMAVRGWSYGGILGGTVITKTDRFKAASLGAMVSDWSSEYGLGFNYDVRLWYIGGTPWNNPEDYRHRSPATHAADVTTPTLFLHGLNDRVDTPAQSQIFFTYLKDIGKVDTRYIKFKREGHGFREPRNQRTRDIEEIKWIQKYTLGLDWEAWERAEKKDKKSDEESEKDS
ncbi:S9 family peptidase [Gracilimonas mengyeensis]|uniref:Dipeptidyl aminopeptidase/acylaminoacyl peptidase n=1 Tax=Gracilimonas mengyeensis TaxID=1302730 RepID=A0A521F4T4_9BACT|nr:S9 family peptidase [Gracilimonas mengyeensis]SMO91198.1 Dipeptidyl aminopeptidase/acylaminoacyl peptidase [Gracilimonas mengyeensis]